MASVTVKNLSNVKKAVTKNLRVKINRIFSDKQVRLDIGQIVKQDIQSTNFGSAGPVTQAYRRYFEQYNATDPTYNRSKINITFTGELLEDLAKNVKGSPTTKQFIIEHSNKLHKKYSKKKGKTKGARVTYSFISEQIYRLGYRYLIFSNRAKAQLTKVVRKKLEQLLINSSR